MKYVMLGTIDAAWTGKHAERVRTAQAKLKTLGIKLELVLYTQGAYDFVDVVEAPNPEAMLSFAVWYVGQGLGRIQSLPAFEAKAFEAAIKQAAA